MHPFAFMTATEILFGRGTSAQASKRAAALGRHIFLVYGANALRADWLATALQNEGCAVTRFGVGNEPDIALTALAIWSRTHGLPTLAEMGLTPQDCALAADAALTSSSMQANPARLTLADLHDILSRA